MFRRKLHNHEETALIEALACIQSVKDLGIEISESTQDTLKAMLGIKGTMDESINKAIASSIENEKEVA